MRRLADGANRAAALLPALGPFRPAKGYFSALEKLQAGALEGQVLADGQPAGTCPAGSMTERCGMRQHDYQPWPVFWTRDEAARLTGRLRQWRDAGDRICLEGNYYGTTANWRNEGGLLAQSWLEKERYLPGAWTSLVSTWGSATNYYHWLTDCLTRLSVRERLPEPTRVLIPQSQASFVQDTLEILGVADVCEAPADTHLRVERFYFCSPMAMTGAWNPLGCDWLRAKFSSCMNAGGSGEPVFLTRRARTRVPSWLGELERFFERKGFLIVDCGALRIREQIQLMSRAKAIAGIHGAAMTNVLWATPGTPVLEIFQPDFLNACYEQIAFQGRLRYAWEMVAGELPMKALEAWVESAVV